MASKTAQAKKQPKAAKNSQVRQSPDYVKTIQHVLMFPSRETPLPPHVGVVHIAACSYCGQSREVSSLMFRDEDKAEEYVVSRCNCPEAKAEQNARQAEAERKMDLDRAEKQLIEMLGDGAPGYGKIPVDPENLEYLYSGAVAVYDGMLKNITVDVCDGVKVKITKTAKGNLKLTRSDTSTFTQEV